MSDEEQESVSVTIHQYDEDVISLRQIGLGVQPLMLVEPVEDEDGNIGFNLVLSLIDQEDATEVLDLVLHVLKEGT